MAEPKSSPNDAHLRGYLSEEAAEVRGYVRERYAVALRSAEEASERVTTIFSEWSWPAEWSDSQIAAVALWVRAMTAFQSAILLAERALIAEAQVLVRTGAECLFYSGALHFDPELLNRMHANDDRHRRTQANAIVDNSRLLSRTSPEHAEFLRRLAATPQGSIASLSVEQAAQKAGMDDLYQFAFRGYSFTAGHATLRSLEFVTLDDGEQSGIVFGPTFVHVEQTLNTTTTFLVAAESLLRRMIEARPGPVTGHDA
ncbi:DUF5677 domain-containing protein [Achromobacter pestifer]|uniref:Uncharacterized protein n=1 Tax=Achromobacter pestifer TaxID=1353889 RepID=A0A6S6YVH3_9BURK|nr:DUF5677 domain-containing protein [Achromobacter pestifer]CAB3647727.1 hypothetical protein LMG3431_02594 [Achromobacter pestifer]